MHLYINVIFKNTSGPQLGGSYRCVYIQLSGSIFVSVLSNFITTLSHKAKSILSFMWKNLTVLYTDLMLTPSNT